MRNALILLVVGGLVIVTAGAINNGVAFDVDYVAGTITAVSLFWVSVLVAAALFVFGAVAVYMTQSAAGVTRRKLEKELQATYERLREAEALATRAARFSAAPARGVEQARPASAGEPVAGDADTAVAGEVPPDVAREAPTEVAGESPTAVVTDAQADPDTEAEAERTAVTLAGEPAADDGADDDEPGAPAPA